MPWYDDSPYVPVGVRHALAMQEMRELRHRGVDVQPVEIEGRNIAESFWGRRWCSHLESFSDYANRLPRGRRYVRNGSVCHLAIRAGGVDARVAGREVYRVVVRVKKLSRPKWKAMKGACAGRIGSVLELLQGRLSDRVMEIVTHRDTGLFPKPGEIKLACDCPDWATMCKHAAAVLYGVGNRLDRSPELLFRLRGVDEAELIATDLALPPEAASADALADGDLESIFGIELDSGPGAPRPKARPRGAPRGRTAGKASRSRERGAGAPSAGAAAEVPGDTERGFRPTGALIAGMRARHGWSVAEFAALLGVSGTAVRRWEAAPGPLTLRARARGALTVLRQEIEKYGD